MKHHGSCHCGNIRLVFESDIDPRQIKVRSCQCTFCRKHGTRAVSDPNGRLVIKVADQERLVRYMFAYRTAEFLLCRDCGVYVAAITVGQGEPRAIAQLNAFEEERQFGPAVAVDYNHETAHERIQRRRDVWMPVSLEIG